MNDHQKLQFWFRSALHDLVEWGLISGPLETASMLSYIRKKIRDWEPSNELLIQGVDAYSFDGGEHPDEHWYNTFVAYRDCRELLKRQLLAYRQNKVTLPWNPEVNAEWN